MIVEKRARLLASCALWSMRRARQIAFSGFERGPCRFVEDEDARVLRSPAIATRVFAAESFGPRLADRARAIRGHEKSWMSPLSPPIASVFRGFGRPTDVVVDRVV